MIYSMLGAVLILASFAAGWAVGARRAPKHAPELPAETERERLLAEQRAFRALMRYSPETAYGEAAPDGEV